MEPPLEIPASELEHPRLQTPPPEQEIQPRRSGRRWQFPQLWREFEATSYSLVTAVPQVTEQAFQDWIEPYTEPALLSAPDMALPLLNSGSSTRLYGMRLTAALYNGTVRRQPVDSHMIICHTSVTCETSLLCLYIYHIRHVNMI